MKGLVFFKDGHTEEIDNYTKLNNDVYFVTSSGEYLRINQVGFGHIFNIVTSNNHVIPITTIKRIDLFD